MFPVFAFAFPFQYHIADRQTSVPVLCIGQSAGLSDDDRCNKIFVCRIGILANLVPFEIE